MNPKILEHIEDYLFLWKKLWDLCYPFAISFSHTQPAREDEEELVLLKSRLLEKFPAIAPYFDQYNYPARQAFQKVMDALPSLLQVVEDVSLREKFRKNWNEVHQYLHLLKGDVEESSRHPVRRLLERLGKGQNRGFWIFFLLLLFLAIWKMVDLIATVFPHFLRKYLLG
ncbi:MAG: hypothetical protein V2G33_05055 [bacterium JZ-2024 1]